ncbi:hypothetical protein FRC04_004382 [Tulasnella sp. 424]|nr:hypothetical protein FRC04_004382 [Tulasnella sp. 424]
MASSEWREEGYPLATTAIDIGANGRNDSAGALSLPTPYSGRRHHSRGVLSKARTAFLSTRPLVRYTIIFVLSAFPIYWFYNDISNYFHLRPHFPPPPHHHLGPPSAEEWMDHRPSHSHHNDGDSKWPPPPPPPGKRPSPKEALWAARAQEVKDAFAHAYDGYEKYAFPDDELLPLNKKSVNNFNGWAVTAVDSLDTMLMMGFEAQYNRGVQHVYKSDYAGDKGFILFFETSIRYFGGLLSAYAYTKDPQLLQKAKELGDTLLLALNTTSGYPKFSIRPSDGALGSYWGANRVILAEMGTIQLEYKYLAHLTGNKTYYEKVEHIREMMHAQIDPTTSLLASFWDSINGMMAGRKFSIGALADSGYEYILKQYLLTGKTEKKALDMYLTLAQGIIDNLLYISPERELLFATDIDGPGKGSPSYIYEHLSCFLPGLFALGAHSLDLSPEEKQLHLWIADGLTQTCYISYADQTSGLGPEEMQFVRRSTLWYPQYKIWKKSSAARQNGAVPPGVKLPKDLKPEKTRGSRDYGNRRDAYLLRPETVESIFIMWRVTGDEVWRERGYEIFKAIERHTKTEYGYASVSGVDKAEPVKQNSMPSYFLAETLKYLWLLFRDNDNRYDLDKIVFNTEAHPLPIFKWRKDEIEQFKIPT